jgi:hypothetical protein
MLRLLLGLFLASHLGATVLVDARFPNGNRLQNLGTTGDLIANGVPVYSDTQNVGPYTGSVGPMTAANYVSCPAATTSALNGLTSYRITCYVSTTAGVTFNAVFGATAGGGGGFVMYLENTANLRWYDQTTDGVACSSCITAGQSYKIELASDGASTYVYLDGVLKATRTLFTWPNRGISIGIRSGNGDGAMTLGYVGGFLVEDCFTCPSAQPTPTILSPYMNPKQFRFPFVSPVQVFR